MPCAHFKVTFLGLQEIEKPDKYIKQYNCCDCHSTITIHDDDLWLYEVVEDEEDKTAGV